MHQLFSDNKYTRYGPSLRRQIPYSPFLTDEGVFILHVKTRWLKVTLTCTMYIVIMPLLLITINRERPGGKEVRAGTEKYVLSESEMGLIVCKCDLCGSQAGRGIRICNQGQGFYQSYNMVWYVSYLQEYWRFLRPRASGDAVCFQVVLQGIRMLHT